MSCHPIHAHFTHSKATCDLVQPLANIYQQTWKSVKHVALCTGLKHDLGPFESGARTGTLPLTPLREEQPRLDVENFYYAQEDEVYAAAARDGFTWSVHRPHTVIGKAVGNLMNMGTTLAVYASVCKETGRPFRWPGSQAQWQGISDMTDARVLAKQLVWACNTEAAWNEAFNVVNGDIFRWSGCGRGWPAGSASSRRASTAGPAARGADGRDEARYGERWRGGTAWPSRSSASSPRPGTPTSIWVGRSR